MRVALVAQESAGAQALRLLLRSPHEVAVVVTSVRHAWGAGADIRRAAAGLPCLDAEIVREEAFADVLREHDVDVLLNVHSLFVIHERAVSAPKAGAFNLHPGPLPEFAGMNTVSWAIFEGARDYGTTLHWMAARIDAGAVAYLSRFPVEPDMTGGTLMARAVREGLGLLDRLLTDLGGTVASVPRIAQNLTRRRYYSRSVPGHGWIDWRWTAEQVGAFVRACDYGPFRSPWGRPRMRLPHGFLEVIRAQPTGVPVDAAAGTLRVASGAVEVAASDAWVRLVQVAAPDGRAVAATDVPDLLALAQP